MKQRDINNYFDDLFKLFYRPLCLYALHYIADYQKVEDIVQECFLSLWQKRSAVTEHRAYLYASVRNRCLDELHKTLKNRSLADSDIENFYSEESDSIMQDDSVTEAEIWTAIDSLPDRCREIFLLSKRDGLKYEEIARELSISVNTVRNQISKALRILQSGAKKVIFFIFG